MADETTSYLNDQAVCRTFTSFQTFKNHQENPPEVDEDDERWINLLQSNDVIRLEAPDIQFFPPTKVTWNDSTNSYTKYVVYDGVEHEYVYTLTVVNKGSDNEEVTAITLPDGSVISFEGWGV